MYPNLFASSGIRMWTFLGRHYFCIPHVETLKQKKNVSKVMELWQSRADSKNWTQLSINGTKEPKRFNWRSR